jgi:hypothetical protein
MYVIGDFGMTIITLDNFTSCSLVNLLPLRPYPHRAGDVQTMGFKQLC